ncbi:MAG: SBBP repeat-containing protein [Phycisphaeraceae bacterium]|nr:SBBP repeat-containing protein [Phycisphaerales bacterium]MCB9859423.1 SBBP repeat-containing protein [Phycisphaeraceae bacterium]
MNRNKHVSRHYSTMQVTTTLVAGLACTGSLAADPHLYGVSSGAQLGSTEWDTCVDIALDSSGNSYMTGRTAGIIGGTSYGELDGYLIKVDSVGGIAWVVQAGTSSVDGFYGVVTDSTGDIYITGDTAGDLFGSHAGLNDLIVARYHSDGSLVWGKQLGNANGEIGVDIGLDNAGNIYVAGVTNGDFAGTSYGESDVFLLKLDSAGNTLWTKVFGTSEDDFYPHIFIGTGGKIALAGLTTGDVGGPHSGGNTVDVFLLQLDAVGNPVWSTQLPGFSAAGTLAITGDNKDNVYITSTANGSVAGPSIGSNDAYIFKFDQSGSVAWSTQFGTSRPDSGHGISVDQAGNVYTTGTTLGMFGWPTQRQPSVFVTKHDAAGNLLWVQQPSLDGVITGGIAVAVNAAGQAHVIGTANESFAGPYIGQTDTFMLKLNAEAPCYTDCDENGAVNIFDYICFGNAYSSELRYADCNRDIFFTVFDFLCFGDGYAAGCP